MGQPGQYAHTWPDFSTIRTGMGQPGRMTTCSCLAFPRMITIRASQVVVHERGPGFPQVESTWASPYDTHMYPHHTHIYWSSYLPFGIWQTKFRSANEQSSTLSWPALPITIQCSSPVPEVSSYSAKPEEFEEYRSLTRIKALINQFLCLS